MRTAANWTSASRTIHLSPQTLRHLGHALIARADAAEAGDPRLEARRELTDEGLDKLIEMALNGTSPTVGFFRRHRKVAQ